MTASWIIVVILELLFAALVVVRSSDKVSKGFCAALICSASIYLGIEIEKAVNGCKLIAHQADEQTVQERGLLNGADYTSEGFWIKGGKVIGFSYEEDDPVKNMKCYPELLDDK